jgi:hypothetical protein
MKKHLLILRTSPDSMIFDIESSREFLRSIGRPAILIIEFAALWRVDYFKD